MKGFINKVMIVICGVFLTSAVFANTKDNHNKNNMNTMNAKQKWVCETNASAASTDADKKADDMMKKAMGGKEAFNFAMKHCRDCTKITCSTEQ